MQNCGVGRGAKSILDHEDQRFFRTRGSRAAQPPGGGGGLGWEPPWAAKIKRSLTGTHRSPAAVGVQLQALGRNACAGGPSGPGWARHRAQARASPSMQSQCPGRARLTRWPGHSVAGITERTPPRVGAPAGNSPNWGTIMQREWHYLASSDRLSENDMRM